MKETGTALFKEETGPVPAKEELPAGGPADNESKEEKKPADGSGKDDDKKEEPRKTKKKYAVHEPLMLAFRYFDKTGRKPSLLSFNIPCVPPPSATTVYKMTRFTTEIRFTFVTEWFLEKKAVPSKIIPGGIIKLSALHRLWLHQGRRSAANHPQPGVRTQPQDRQGAVRECGRQHLSSARSHHLQGPVREGGQGSRIAC